MKKLNLILGIILLLSLISANVSAQLTKGSTWLGGTVGYSSYSNESQFSAKQKTQTLYFNPAVGKIVKPGLVVGIEFSYYFHEEKNDAMINDLKENRYGAGVFMRKYIETFKKLYLFGHLKLDGAIGSRDNFNTSPVAKAKGWRAEAYVYPGLSYMLNSRIALEASFYNLFGISYMDYKTKTPGKTYREVNFSALADLDLVGNFGLGIRLILPGKKTN